MNKIDNLWDEVNTYLKQIQLDVDGEHIWSNYQIVVGIILRLQEIHNQLSLLEIAGNASPEEKKFRTMIIDPTIERLEKVASFESRKMTGKQIESQLER